MIIFLVVFILCCLWIVKLANSALQQDRVLDAIVSFYFEGLEPDKHSRFELSMDMMDSMESVTKTTLRFWDWGCKHILTKDKFALIEPYLED